MRQPYDDVIWRIPIVGILLCMRQKLFDIKPDGITLQDKEQMDEMG